jgi:hypothetical protein
MSKLTPAHLPPLVAAWRMALSAGAITTDQAEDFVDQIHTALLEHRVATKTPIPGMPVTQISNLLRTTQDIGNGK